MSQPFFTTNAELILASASPRRRRFLESLGLAFSVHTAEIPEKAEPGEKAADFVRRLALEKARTVSARFPAAWVIGADTVVVLDDAILGKPADKTAAANMLRSLSGRTHQVLTGFSLVYGKNNIHHTDLTCTDVTFAPLSEGLCRAYAATGEPLDKAGAYGIQGMGGCLVQSITGSYSNVVGLPLSELVNQLQRFKVIRPRTTD